VENGLLFFLSKTWECGKKNAKQNHSVFCGRGHVILICKEPKLKSSTSKTCDDDYYYAITSMMNDSRVFLHTLKITLKTDR